MQTTNEVQARLWSAAPLALGMLGLAVVMSASGCKASPCSDDNRELTANLAPLPLIDDEASVCSARIEEGWETAMIMRWGDELAPAQTKLMLEMDGAGWGQTSCNASGNQTNPDPDEFCFEKDGQHVSASFELHDSKQLGINMPAIITHVHWFPAQAN